MILDERFISLTDAGNLFNIIAEELTTNPHTQIVISDDILKALRNTNHVSHSYEDNFEVNEWYKLHQKHDSPVIAKLGVKSFGRNYSHLTKFYFSVKSHQHREFNDYAYDVQRILVILVS